jgi:putative NADH-flavin reductase
MNITVFGATGGTGTIFVEIALVAGYEVTAVVRDPARLKIDPRAGLRVVTADVMDPSSIAPVLKDAEAVVNFVGPHGLGPTTIQRDSVRSILRAMETAGASRLLHVSGSSTVDDGESWYMHVIKPVARATFLGNSATDMRGAESLIRASDTEWTIFRPPALKSKPARGRYRTAIDRNLPHGFSVTRADLAACMVAMLPDPAIVGHHVGVAN